MHLPHPLVASSARRLAALLVFAVMALPGLAGAQSKPNILVIWGDDIGTWNISHNNRGMMGYRTPNIDRIAQEGVGFTDYGQQSCTAGRAAFINGSVPVRTGMTKVGMPAAKEGWQKSDVTMATVLKSQGYTTGQFGKNHQGDRDEHLPTMHGFDEFLGNLYHLNAEEEPENRDYPGDMVLANGKTFREQFGPRGVLKCKADGKGGQSCEDTGPLTKKRMETIDEETLDAAIDFIKRQHAARKPFFVWWNATRMHFRTHVKEAHRGGPASRRTMTAATAARTSPASPARIHGRREGADATVLSGLSDVQALEGLRRTRQHSPGPGTQTSGPAIGLHVAPTRGRPRSATGD